MTAAFRVNLTALSLLALLVGLFLIYNTITFSIVQRRPYFGTLRCLGVTRQEIFVLVMGEALLVGLVGSGLGILAGILLGQGAVGLVTQTINDLFFVVSIRGIQIPVESLIKGGFVGIVATLITAAPPAWEAASVPPRTALYRSGLEDKARKAVIGAAYAGGGLILLGSLILLLIPTNNLVVSFGGTFAVIVGFAMLTPLITKTVTLGAIPVLGKIWGVLGRLAPRDLVNSISRTAIAIAALMVAVSVTIGVSLMINSFRYTVETWLSQTLQGDIYISSPGQTSSQPGGVINPEVVSIVAQTAGVADLASLRAVSVESNLGSVNLTAIDHPIRDPGLFLTPGISPDEIWAKMQEGAIIVSEPFANRFGIPRTGDEIELLTKRGMRNFPVVAVFSDYASTQGTIRMTLDAYRSYWDDPQVSALALFIEPGVDAAETTRFLQDTLAPTQRLFVRSNLELRNEALAVFDRTFAITNAMRLLATLVAFIGILSALLALLLEKQRQMGILRAVGLTNRQLWGYVLLQTGLMGSVAGLLAMPAGYILSLILVYIINLRSFGWTLQMQVTPEPFLSAYLIALVAAILAGLYPAYKITSLSTAEAIRGE
jgi:putative ABC transport system permease protein